jgi:transcriptional regulator with XRE-family HTH domain
MKSYENQSKLAKNLIAFRKSMGLTQKQVAESLNIKRSTYAYYERDTMPSTTVIEKLAKLYNVEPGEILFPKANQNSVVLKDEDGLETPKIQFATLLEAEQDLLIKMRLLTEEKKVKLLNKLDELLSEDE